MPNFVLNSHVESRKIPFGTSPGDFRCTWTDRASNQVVKQQDYPNANIPFSDVGEGQYRISLVRLDATTRSVITTPVDVDYDVVAPVAEVPVSFTVVPA